MQMRAKRRPEDKGSIIPNEVVITTCSHRKFAKPTRAATPSSLARGIQTTVAAHWIAKVGGLNRWGAADAFYAGRAFGLARDAANLSTARFYILSAGLGIVPASRRIPAYGLTIAPRHEQSVRRKIVGDFDPADWFSTLLKSAHSDQWSDVASGTSGRILLALSRPYAEMVGASLSEAPPKMLERLRIFGASLEVALPAKLHAAIAPYDERLNAIFPGTRTDFAQRAMLHFVKSVAIKPSKGREDDFAAVRSSLKGLQLPRQVQRPRLTDDEIVAVIKRRLRMQSGAARMLAALRHEEGVACEQARFGRLYRIAAAKKGT
ncbi:hypothetical protein [Bradyrhizobium brasilense]|uniref:hypothetical protein n=1 Tax=Bradyrhizobium brasilense TaxID=1419277 RepID=UPI001E2CAE04|nr:hypothetical protein [Bradyrhizobium brasilense]MCC8970038.1 hypothetical protein [Bradyrhizobium brasilense]